MSAQVDDSAPAGAGEPSTEPRALEPRVERTEPGDPPARSLSGSTVPAEPPRRPAEPGTERVAPLRRDWRPHAEVEVPIEVDEDSDELSREEWEGTAASLRTPGQRLVRALVYRAGPALLLVGVIALCLVEAGALVEPAVKTGEGARDAAPVEVPRSGGAAESEARSPESGLVLKARGKSVQGLARIGVERVTEDERVELVELGKAALASKRVTVINLWATWCAPCKQEFPGLRAMFEEIGGEDVAFVPIMVSDAKDPVWAHRRFARLMPATAAFLVDNQLSDGVQEVLRAAKVLPQDSGLPATLVLDCRQRVRLAHTGALRERDFAALRAMLVTLREELSGEYCNGRAGGAGAGGGARTKEAETNVGMLLDIGRTVEEEEDPEVLMTVSHNPSPRPTPEVSTLPPEEPIPPPGGECGNGRCEEHESCRTCKRDCACLPHERCAGTGGGYRCILAPFKLED